MTAVAAKHEAGVESQGSTPNSFVPKARRVVLDTNVLVSLYVFADSRFEPLRTRIENGEWQAVTNDACFGEFRRVLGYPLFALTEAQQANALDAYAASTARHDGTPIAPTIALPRCKDRDDQKFLELARDGKADWLVTADKALLRLARRDRLRGLFRILTPEAALTETCSAPRNAESRRRQYGECCAATGRSRHDGFSHTIAAGQD